MSGTLNFSMRCLARPIVGLMLCASALNSFAYEGFGTPGKPQLASIYALAKTLMRDIEHLSRYWASKRLPTISVVSQNELNQVICKKPCAVRAAYIPGRGVLLADTLDPVNEALDRSILVHELVHFLQEVNNRYSELTPCKRWFQREHEAYAVQNQYLYRINANRHVGGMLEPSLCKDDPIEKKSNTFQPDADRTNVQ